MAENSKLHLEDAFRHKFIKFISYSELENLTRVDSGKFGSIHTAYWHKLRKIVAVKRLHSFAQNDTAIQNFVHELQIQKRVEYHDRMIRIFGVSQDPSNRDYLLILQYADGGNLRNYFAQNYSTLTWNDKFRISHGIIDALRCLHDEDIVHRDLHSKNILIDQGEPKIADFETPIVGTPQEYKLLYQQCWNPTPHIRPSVDDVLQSIERIIKQAENFMNDVEEAPSPEMSAIPPDQHVKATDQTVQYNLIIPDNTETLADSFGNQDLIITEQSQQSLKINLPSTSGSSILPASSNDNDNQSSQNPSFIKDPLPRISRKTDIDKINVKVVIVGDGAAGKSCFLFMYSHGHFPEVYVPTVFENYCVDFKIDGQPVVLGLWDTAGQENYDNLRPLSYPGSDVAIIVFAIDNPDSLDNVYEKWISEVKHFLPKIPIFLVGTKLDLRDDMKTIEELKKVSKKPVTYEEGFQAAEHINAKNYFECSALTGEGLNEAFEQIIRAGLWCSICPMYIKITREEYSLVSGVSRIVPESRDNEKVSQQDYIITG
ncbi:2267_t:CDS:2 [Diversispora eburnea]|uniref:2267_t:CDS:1 n=1 Tax=Diversispora eburnea TaxID=1213867 RepID=A0A9N9CNI1_9GLOM|nr:2267_t:CDS:2 [Diversispora eburnea]